MGQYLTEKNIDDVRAYVAAHVDAIDTADATTATSAIALVNEVKDMLNEVIAAMGLL